MNESASPPPNPELSVAVVEQGNRLTVVWIIPLVALLIGGWLAYKTISEQGPTITITFKTAEGLQAGKTKIKYKSVELGQVKTITLNKDLSQVMVSAELTSGTEKYLTNQTRFWVVRAHVAADQVSDIGTLFSGAYIGIDPVSTGKPTRSFVGLERPPAVTADTAGRHFVLQAKSLGSLHVGSPVFFRKIKVGQVVEEFLSEDGETATIQVFIRAPHDQKVLENSRFWNAGGIDFTIDASGIKVNTESIVTLMLGGISFDIPPTEQRGKIADENQIFMLYESRDNINEKVFQKRTRWLVYFGGSVRGLKSGAPVEFLGLKIGKVVDVRMEYQPGEREFHIPVILEIEPERIITGGNIPHGDQRRKLMNEMVRRGLRAQLKSGNILTGQLFVEIAIHPQATPAEIDWESHDYPAFPTIPQPLEGITNSVAEILTRLQKIPFEQIGQDLGATARGAKQLVHSDELRASIRALEATLHETQQTMRSIHQMADYLERHPEALLKGKQ